jgi:hypothetical protein
MKKYVVAYEYPVGPLWYSNVLTIEAESAYDARTIAFSRCDWREGMRVLSVREVSSRNV